MWGAAAPDQAQKKMRWTIETVQRIHELSKLVVTCGSDFRPKQRRYFFFFAAFFFAFFFAAMFVTPLSDESGARERCSGAETSLLNAGDPLNCDVKALLENGPDRPRTSNVSSPCQAKTICRASTPLNHKAL